MAEDRVLKVRGERVLAARAGHLFADIRAEFACAARDLDTWSRPEVRAGVAQQLRARLLSGVTVRKLYTSAALTDEEQRRHLQELDAVGAQVRISTARLPNEMIVVDWRAMVLAGPLVGDDRELHGHHLAVAVDRLDVRPGGAIVTRLSEDGVEFVPHLDASFLVVNELERIVFTNAIDSAWRPTNPAPVPMTAEITLSDHPDGTDYRILVRHGDPAARARHEELGFADGWGSVSEQLARLAESQNAR